jgi:hypothetical protein
LTQVKASIWPRDKLRKLSILSRGPGHPGAEPEKKPVMRVFKDFEELKAAVGTEIGVSQR